MDAPKADRLDDGFVLGEWCVSLLAALKAGGVTDVIVSPGSRNTPLTLCALADSALQCHSVIDERSAGFFGLGLAKTQRGGVALLCTSGSAGAHYHPAIVEAYYAQVSLVVITADRPPELQGCGAPQTIEQPGMFAPHVRAELNAPPPTADPQAHVSLCSSVRDLVRASCRPTPGPVHLNVPFRKPLEPRVAGSERELNHEGELKRSRRSQRSLAPEEVEAPDLTVLLSALANSNRPLITAGPLTNSDLESLRDLAADASLPLLEEFGGGSSNGFFEFLPPHLEGEAAPDLIVHIGPPVVSTQWAQYLKDCDVELHVLPGTVFQDPSRRAKEVLLGDLTHVMAGLRCAVAPRAAWKSYRKTLDSIQGQLLDRQSDALRAVHSATCEPLAVKNALVAAADGDADLLLGNSLPIRLASWTSGQARAAMRAPITARGANGIDGTLAWAYGAVTGRRHAGVLLLGDVTFAHDVSSLGFMTKTTHPLVVILLDNGGGRIFDHLPARQEISEERFEFWTTTPQVDFEQACRAYGVDYRCLGSVEQVTDAIEQALTQRRSRVIHVLTSPESTMRFLQEMRSVGGDD